MSLELSDEQRNKLSELLRKFSGLFTKTDKSTAAKTNVKHRIFTGDHAPINQRAYRVSPTERRIIHEEVQKMLDEGIVQPSESPWSSPVVLSLLKSGVEFHWGPEEVEAFNSLKKALTSDPVLGMYDETEIAEIAKFLLEEIVLRHGALRVIITDRGAVFRSRLVSSLVDLCNIDHRFTTAYHPQTNGLTERFNKTLADMLSMYVDVEQKNWDEILPFVTFAYNTAKQETTGFTPFYLLHGHEAETTLDTMLPFYPNDFDDNNITKIAARAEESRQLARVHTLRAQDKDRRRYDSKHQMVSYAPGDLVWVYTPVRKVGLSEKLLRRYFGPYQVLRRLSAVTYAVQDFDPASRKKEN
ncbi:retrovirus-related Pol polyprotein from transposon 412 [Trichonephila clavipes]|nr:retrovirus-related Pol polyprotein from transposon 412 [Trichonephila clavipes]